MWIHCGTVCTAKSQHGGFQVVNELLIKSSYENMPACVCGSRAYESGIFENVDKTTYQALRCTECKQCYLVAAVSVVLSPITDPTVEKVDG